MAARQIEIAQKALRRPDYDSLSESDDGGGDGTAWGDEPSSAKSSFMQKRGQPLGLALSSSYDQNVTSSFDPYAPQSETGRASSLFDDCSAENGSTLTNSQQQPPSSSTIPGISGAAAYLEMEEEPPRRPPVMDEPIKTDSGLLLTHRRSPSSKKPLPAWPDRRAQTDYFEVEHGRPSYPRDSRHSMLKFQARRLKSYVKIWMVLSAAFLLATTVVLLHSFGHAEAREDTSTITAYQEAVDYQQSEQQPLVVNTGASIEVGKVVLLPIEEDQQLSEHSDQDFFTSSQIHIHHNDQQNTRRHLTDLRDEFESWILHHGKTYQSAKEKERRFHIWSDNHHKTIEKNLKHGPCKLTKQSVFGSNHLKDLTPDEFKTTYLTGYNGPKTDTIEQTQPNVRKMNQSSRKVLNPDNVNNMHELIRQKINKHRAARGQRLLKQQPVMQATSNPNCAWYDVSCLLRWLWQSAGVQFGTIIGTMEPMYDSDAYPNAVDWRDHGAVTDVRSQGDCGACWAITAVETIESAHYLSTGTLYDLSEAEVITCDDSCDMCSGGWPQNAYEWAMSHGGLPLYHSFPFDASSLLSMTEGIEGTSSYWDEDTVNDYRQQVCPSESYGSSDSGSQDYNDEGEENGNYGDYSSQGRYGNIEGYGYATERCICYSDGSGCDCDDQNEGMAVGNVASHGPAVVCLEASLWQDYSGGIITSESGCGSAFLDMNHCVQIVGYAFTDGSDEDEVAENNGSGSGSGSNSGSQDDSKREGYWIVRNQWGNYWGMNGYAYVAMGENTCGILNDMTQAY